MQMQFFPSKDNGLSSEPLPHRAPSVRGAPRTAGCGDGGTSHLMGAQLGFFIRKWPGGAVC